MKHQAASVKKNKTAEIFSLQFQTRPNAQYPKATAISLLSPVAFM